MKNNIVYVCKECGYETPKWQGQCICGAWNSFYEQKIETQNKNTNKTTFSETQNLPKEITEINYKEEDRILSGIKEFDRTLGGGIMPASVSLITGEPGIGKSTLLLQLAINLANSNKNVLYISGEESLGQIKGRADRVNNKLPKNLFIFSETNLENIFLELEKKKYDLIIIDSIQTMWTDKIDSSSGGISQIKEVTALFVSYAKNKQIPVFLVAHITKDGEISGPKIIEHLVDTVLYFSGEKTHDFRLVTAIKNRFGRSGEIGAFEMHEDGLKEIADISSLLVSSLEGKNKGGICTGVVEGSKTILFELQSLTAKSSSNYPRRVAIGLDLPRLNMLLAVFENSLNVNLFYDDVYLNIVGDIKPIGRGTDLPAILSIYSAKKNLMIDKNIFAIGEVSLTGEIRFISKIESIIREAKKFGFKKIIIPKRNFEKLKEPLKKEVIPVSNITEAVKKVLS